MSSNESHFAIDFSPASAFRYLDYDAIVCIAVIRATTTLVTAVASGRQTFAAAELGEAERIARFLRHPLLAGTAETAPAGSYEASNSPQELHARTDISRPLVLVSTHGTQLIANARGCRSVFVASLRNLSATAEILASSFRRVALLGACSEGEMRCEDQIAAARLGTMLRQRGFHAESRSTALTIDRWGEADASLIRLGRSAERLLQAGRGADLEFILGHVDDLDFACRSTGTEIHRIGYAPRSATVAASAAAGASERQSGLHEWIGAAHPLLAGA